MDGSVYPLMELGSETPPKPLFLNDLLNPPNPLFLQEFLVLVFNPVLGHNILDG
jgi:hypothetical protein